MCCHKPSTPWRVYIRIRKDRVKRGGRAHFDYISGDGKYKRIGTEDDIRLTRSNAIPSWAKSPRDFLERGKKKSETVFEKIELALPVELEPKNQERLVEQFVNKKNFKDYPCTYAIHDSKNGEILMFILCFLKENV